MSSFAIAGCEVRRLLRDRALPALLILLLGLSAYAAWNGADWAQEREAAIGLIKAADQAWLTGDGRHFVAQSYPSVILPITQPVLAPTAMAPPTLSRSKKPLRLSGTQRSKKALAWAVMQPR